jgi:Flp pilus assembly protein TadD
MTDKSLDDIRSQAESLAAEAAVLFHNGRYEAALRLFEAAIRIDDGNARAHTGKSLVLAQLGRPGEGLRAAEDAVGRGGGKSATAYTALAFCYHRLGREDEAQASFERALVFQPDESRVLYNYACYWAELGDEDKCREYLARAFPAVEDHTLDHAPHDPDLARYVNKDWFRELLAAAKVARRNSRYRDRNST